LENDNSELDEDVDDEADNDEFDGGGDKLSIFAIDE
jgi:hypothetical protein